MFPRSRSYRRGLTRPAGAGARVSASPLLGRNADQYGREDRAEGDMAPFGPES
jgi:hypothetical protein